LYDQVLDAALAIGALPARFDALREPDGSIGLAATFAAARGSGEQPPLELTKWFDTNYHYLVPEIGPETVFAPSSDRLVRQFAEAREDGFVTRPVLVGPVTLLALSKATDAAALRRGGAHPPGFRPLDRLGPVDAEYRCLLADLREARAQ